MRKLLAFILATGMVFSLAACGGQKTETVSPETKDTQVQTEINEVSDTEETGTELPNTEVIDTEAADSELPNTEAQVEETQISEIQNTDTQFETGTITVEDIDPSHDLEEMTMTGDELGAIMLLAGRYESESGTVNVSIYTSFDEGNTVGTIEGTAYPDGDYTFEDSFIVYEAGNRFMAEGLTGIYCLVFTNENGCYFLEIMDLEGESLDKLSMVEQFIS